MAESQINIFRKLKDSRNYVVFLEVLFYSILNAPATGEILR